MSRIVLDLETPRSFQDVGGYHNIHLLGVSLLGVYFYDTDTYKAYRADDLPQFEEYLIQNKPEMVGFNQIHFDLPVLQPYCQHMRLASLPQIDIMAQAQESEGFRIKLESFAQATLYEGKSGHGLDAIRYYREGNWEDLERYCLDDVRLTKDLYDYGQHHGYIWYKSGAEQRKVPVPWAQTQTIANVLSLAATNHQRVAVEFIDLRNTVATREKSTFDIQRYSENAVIAYCHRRHEVRQVPVARFIDASIISENSTHQAQLF